MTIFRQLLETFVHEPWVKELDFSTAETVEHSFISEAYKETESDLIYKLKLNGEDVFIYVLLEFQSSVDRFISVRILNYITNMYMAMLNAKEIKDKLPPVFPILLYNGDPTWTAPKTVAETIERHDLLGGYGIGFKYLKIVENEYSSETLLKIQNIVSTLFLAENHYNFEQLEHELLILFEKEDRIAVSLFLNWFRMLAIDGRIDSTNYRAFEKIYTNQMEVRQMFATAISEKDKRLLEEGKVEGKVETARRMLADGMSVKAVSKYTGLSEEDIKKLV